MKRVSVINETIKFNNTKISGMKEIMVKAHALARLIRLPDETYAHAFRNALKEVWRKIKHADMKQKHVYIYFVNGAYAFAETQMDISVAADYFAMIDVIDKISESAVSDVEKKDDLYYGKIQTKEELRLVLFEYINAWLPQLKDVENFNKNVGMPEYTIDNELRTFINNGVYKKCCTTVKEILIQFIYEFRFTTKCRIERYVSAYYSADDKKKRTLNEKIADLEYLGAKRWTKGEYDRLYLKNMVYKVGLEVNRYNTGSISYSAIDRNEISHSHCGKILMYISSFYYDIKNKEFNVPDTTDEDTNLLIKRIKKMVNEKLA